MTKNTIYPIAYIYMIESGDGSKRYIGSTGNIHRRIISHKALYNRFMKGKTNYCSSFDIINNPNYNVSIIETHTNINKEALLIREGELILKHNGINKCKAGRKKKDIDKEYYIKNANALKAKRNARYAACASMKSVCSICKESYSVANKHNHMNTLKHMNAEMKQVKKSNEIILKFVKRILNQRQASTINTTNNYNITHSSNPVMNINK